MTWPVTLKMHLGIVSTLQEVESLSEEYDPYVLDGTTSLINLIEDEIILELPVVPVHDDSVCQLPQEYQRREQETVHPFALLEKLRRKHE